MERTDLPYGFTYQLSSIFLLWGASNIADTSNTLWNQQM